VGGGWLRFIVKPRVREVTKGVRHRERVKKPQKPIARLRPKIPTMIASKMYPMK